jgi:hypothetical protein
MAVFWVAATIALMMEAAQTSETLLNASLHGVTTQQTFICVLTAVRNLNRSLMLFSFSVIWNIIM